MTVVVKKSALADFIKKHVNEDRMWASRDIAELEAPKKPVFADEQSATQLTQENVPVEDENFQPTNTPELQKSASQIAAGVKSQDIQKFYNRLKDLAKDYQNQDGTLAADTNSSTVSERLDKMIDRIINEASPLDFLKNRNKPAEATPAASPFAKKAPESSPAAAQKPTPGPAQATAQQSVASSSTDFDSYYDKWLNKPDESDEDVSNENDQRAFDDILDLMSLDKPKQRKWFSLPYSDEKAKSEWNPGGTFYKPRFKQDAVQIADMIMNDTSVQKIVARNHANAANVKRLIINWIRTAKGGLPDKTTEFRLSDMMRDKANKELSEIEKHASSWEEYLKIANEVIRVKSASKSDDDIDIAHFMKKELQDIGSNVKRIMVQYSDQSEKGDYPRVTWRAVIKKYFANFDKMTPEILYQYVDDAERGVTPEEREQELENIPEPEELGSKLSSLANYFEFSGVPGIRQWIVNKVMPKIGLVSAASENMKLQSFYNLYSESFVILAERLITVIDAASNHEKWVPDILKLKNNLLFLEEARDDLVELLDYLHKAEDEEPDDDTLALLENLLTDPNSFGAPILKEVYQEAIYNDFQIMYHNENILSINRWFKSLGIGANRPDDDKWFVPITRMVTGETHIPKSLETANGQKIAAMGITPQIMKKMHEMRLTWSEKNLKKNDEFYKRVKEFFKEKLADNPKALLRISEALGRSLGRLKREMSMREKFMTFEPEKK